MPPMNVWKHEQQCEYCKSQGGNPQCKHYRGGKTAKKKGGLPGKK